MQDERPFINTNDPKFLELKVGDQVIAIHGYALPTNEPYPAPGDRGFVVDHKAIPHAQETNVSVQFFGFEKVYDFSPKFLQKISNSQPVCKDEWARSTEKAREWLHKRGYDPYGDTVVIPWVGHRGGDPSPTLDLTELLALYQADSDADFDPTESAPSLHWQIEHLKGCMSVYQGLNEQYRHASIVELAVDNPNLAEYAKHWEGRATKAETLNERKEATIEDYRKIVTAQEKEIEMLKIVATETAQQLDVEQRITGLYKTAVEVMAQTNSTLQKRVMKMENEAIIRNIALENKSKELDQYVDLGKRQGDEINLLVEELVVATGIIRKYHRSQINTRSVNCQLVKANTKLAERVNELSSWLNEAAQLLHCDLDQVASAILRRNPVHPKTVDVYGAGQKTGFYAAHCDFSVDATAQLLYYLGSLFNELHAGLPAVGGPKARGVLYFSPKIYGSTFRNLQRAWNRSCFGQQAQDWEKLKS